MASFRKAVITAKGRELLVKALAENSPLTFSSIKTGDGAYTGSEPLEDVAALKSVKNSFPVTSLQRVDNKNFKIKSTISNTDVTVGYNMTEYGIYARTGSQPETLFAICTAIEADFFPDYASSPLTILLEIYIQISNAEQITFTYTVPTGVYASITDMANKVDISEFHAQLAILKSCKEVKVLASGWSPKAPYMQRIDIAGMKAVDTPVIGHKIDKTMTDPSTVAALWEAFSCLDKAETFDGYLILECDRECPDRDFTISIKGVGV